MGEGSSNDPTTSPPVDEDKWCDEEGYFSSYTHFNIHEEMLKVRFIEPINRTIDWSLTARMKYGLKHTNSSLRKTLMSLRIKLCWTLGVVPGFSPSLQLLLEPSMSLLSTNLTSYTRPWTLLGELKP